MESALMHGSLIFIRKLKHGSIVQASVDVNHLIKRYLVPDGEPVLRPDNPAYPDPVCEHEMKALGVV